MTSGGRPELLASARALPDLPLTATLFRPFSNLPPTDPSQTNPPQQRFFGRSRPQPPSGEPKSVAVKGSSRLRGGVCASEDRNLAKREKTAYWQAGPQGFGPKLVPKQPKISPVKAIGADLTPFSPQQRRKRAWGSPVAPPLHSNAFLSTLKSVAVRPKIDPSTATLFEPAKNFTPKTGKRDGLVHLPSV